MVLVISHKKKLAKKYGKNGFSKIEKHIKKLQKAMQTDSFESYLIFVDDKTSCEQFNLKPISKYNGKEIKKLVKNYSQKNELQDLLIIGGHDIIPFHKIINTADPYDKIVYSDAPYGSADSDYLIPDWSVGRMPDGKSNNLKLLINQIKTATDAHSTKIKSKSFACSAKVWTDASQRVYQNITSGSRLLVSPNSVVSSVNISKASYHYYNLHGADDTPYWYGDSGYEPLPISLSAKTIGQGKVKDAIVFSEACYGAYTINKNPSDSIALRYLEQGTRAFLGSTAVAYGSSDQRLFAADMIAEKFLRMIKAGIRIGEALMKTKIEYFGDNYGDGSDDEFDVKTLIEFVLYGDPTLKGKK